MNAPALDRSAVAPAAPSVIPPVPAKRQFSATIGDSARHASGAATVTVQQRAVQVGCTMTGVTLAACEVELYATVSGDHAVASHRVLVGSGKVEADDQTSRLHVRVVLNGTGRDLLRRSKTGFRVRVAIKATPVSGTPVQASGTARLVARRTTFVLAGFGVDRATLPAAARRALRGIVGLTSGGASWPAAGATAAS